MTKNSAVRLLLFCALVLSYGARGESVPTPMWRLPSGAIISPGVVQLDRTTYFYLKSDGTLLYYTGAVWQKVPPVTPPKDPDADIFASLGGVGRGLSGNQATAAGTGLASATGVANGPRLHGAKKSTAVARGVRAVNGKLIFSR